MVLPIVIGVFTGVTLFYTARLIPRVLQRVALMECPPITSAAAASVRRAPAPYRIYEYGFKKKMTDREAYLLLGFSVDDSRLPYPPTEGEVKKHYRGLIKELHSDVGGSTYIMMKLNEAKDILIQQ
ncbi:unnamed protein product [Phytomonas sp. Hart1]|nr:unnamed protein product [Phytomonas sp. Hart1]|eukprot:CCW65942.1 unnamed protein product [Phytomonas sp. isolate Hart1]